MTILHITLTYFAYKCILLFPVNSLVLSFFLFYFTLICSIKLHYNMTYYSWRWRQFIFFWYTTSFVFLFFYLSIYKSFVSSDVVFLEFACVLGIFFFFNSFRVYLEPYNLRSESHLSFFLLKCCLWYFVIRSSFLFFFDGSFMSTLRSAGVQQVFYDYSLLYDNDVVVSYTYLFFISIMLMFFYSLVIHFFFINFVSLFSPRTRFVLKDLRPDIRGVKQELDKLALSYADRVTNPYIRKFFIKLHSFINYIQPKALLFKEWFHHSLNK